MFTPLAGFAVALSVLSMPACMDGREGFQKIAVLPFKRQNIVNKDSNINNSGPD